MKRLVITIIIGISGPAIADTALERRIATYDRICSDYERSKRHVECHKPPGNYKHAYEMTGEARQRALKQGRRLMDIRRNTDRDLNNNRRRIYR